MKVLLVSHTCISRAAGQQKAELLSAKYGVEVLLLVPHRWKDYGIWKVPEEPIHPTFIFKKSRICWAAAGPAKWYFHWYPGLKKILEDFQPDIIDLWEEPWGLVSAQICWLRDRYLPHAKVVGETEQNMFRRLPPPFGWLQQYVLNRVDMMVGRSEEALQVIRRRGYAGPGQVVPNAVDEQVFRRMDRDKCRNHLKVTGFVVGYVGRLVEEKGLGDLLHAIALCPELINLLIVGSGPYELEVRRLITEMNLAGRVRMIPSIPSSDLPSIYNAMDVLAVPSRTTNKWKEQFGRVIIEAHACGLPIVGSDSGAIPKVIGSGGLVVPEQNPAALAEAFQTLLADPSLRSQLAKNGLAFAIQHFTWMAVAGQMFEIYARTFASPAVRPNASPHLQDSQLFAPAERV